MKPKTIRWLHISDLHMGCRGEELWWQVRDEFKRSIEENSHLLPVDMILVTGDITYQGKPEEFDRFDLFLKNLLGWLRAAGKGSNDPLVIPVPGNHDLVRPTTSDLRNYRVLENFWKAPDHDDIGYFRDELWRDRNASLFDPLFGNYMGWLEKKILPRLEDRPGVSVRRSHFPGDLSVRIDLEGKSALTVVGLNSAWMQYTDADFERKIELFTQQLHFALGDCKSGSPLDDLEGRQNLLLMHHPPAWLSHASRQRFNDDIYHPDRFLLCLHGHKHQGRSEAISQSGGKFRYFFQAPSLFGLERYGRSNETRAMGYAWGEMDAAGNVRVWPFKRDRQGGAQAFIWDTEFGDLARDGHFIRPVTAPPAVAASVDIIPWLTSVLERTGHIEISGIGSGVGRTKDASRYPIEQLYTTLRSRGAAEDLAGRTSPESLADLLPRHPLLLIEGQPGAGKTTFLHLVATMLARDILGISCPDRSSWREKHLGMDGRAKPRVPLFLRLSELPALLDETKDKEDSDDRRRLLDLLARTSNAADGDDWRAHWEGLLARGEAILLLDGLDEVADDRLRRRVFAIFRDACRHWKKSQVVVTSRPFATEAVRKMGFHHAVIEDFGKGEVREFIERWAAALHTLPIGERPEGAAGEKSDRIIQAVLGRPAIRRLAANPVMLTCLCVVHWNEGDLPEGRARVYRAVIRWLLAARTPLREREGFTDRFAHEAFAALAFAMMGGAKGGKVAVADLERGAVAIEPLIRREFPKLKSKPARLRRAREWIRWECLWSGIVEEQAGGSIRFWHLTFQEYLAAQALAWRGDGDHPRDDWWPVIGKRLEDLQWRETVELLPGALFDEGGKRRVDRFLERVLSLRGSSPALPEDARVFGILDRILRPMTAYQYRPLPKIERVQGELKARILPMFEREGAAKVPVEVRIEAAEALGRGDPRLEGDNMIEVPDTAGVSLGRYPVTVMEYEAFVDAGGYREAEYWDQQGWRLRENEGWEAPDGWDEQQDHPNRPVVSVSWYEAVAYCRWRSAENGRIIRLPTEKEWAAAATPDGLEYPWGPEEPDPERANFANNVGRPTPVGVYPAGNGPYGHCDLAGNVWEWMEDCWDEEKDTRPHGGIGAVTDGDRRSRVLRGGSWSFNPRFLRSAFRIRFTPVDRLYFIGFRVARTLD